MNKIKTKFVEIVIKEQNKAQETNEDMKKNIRACIERGKWGKKKRVIKKIK